MVRKRDVSMFLRYKYRTIGLCPENGKVSYPTKPDADKARKTIRRQGKRGGYLPKQPYRCRHCNDWHLTSHRDGEM